MPIEKNNENNVDLSNIFNDPIEKTKQEQKENKQVLPPQTSKMISWLIKDEKLAKYILIIFAIIVFIISLYLFYTQMKPKKYSIPPEFINSMQQNGAPIPR